MSEKNSIIDKDDTPLPFWFISIVPVMIVVVFGLFLFPASKWAWDWLEAWLLIGVMAVITFVGYAIINQKNPRVIRNRAKIKKIGLTKDTKKSAESDWYIMPLMTIGFLGAFLFPPLEKRFNWYPSLFPLPLWAELIGLVVMATGFIFLMIAQVQNAFASKLLDINKAQKLIDTGLYAKVRHPLYSGAIFWALGSPIALGSVIGLAGSFLVILALIIRIKPEEEMLIQ
ncbi:MAG: isoprenylcysteine carboxylmethyltransferase family protein [Promethearchaeota archaeon]|nr:MAG: isoprenylcysteine carboxylmethyltransferase family protein [Candidatus Lokiarchaeota archaeon]